MADLKRCNIIDRGLTGLQHAFLSLADPVTNPTLKWGTRYAELCSPSFWEPQPSVIHGHVCLIAAHWLDMTHRGRLSLPKGGNSKIFAKMNEQKPLDRSNGVHRNKVKVAGRIVSQPKRPKT